MNKRGTDKIMAKRTKQKDNPYSTKYYTKNLKDRATQTPLKSVVNSGAPEE